MSQFAKNGTNQDTPDLLYAAVEALINYLPISYPVWCYTQVNLYVIATLYSNRFLLSNFFSIFPLGVSLKTCHLNVKIIHEFHLLVHYAFTKHRRWNIFS